MSTRLAHVALAAEIGAPIVVDREEVERWMFQEAMRQLGEHQEDADRNLPDYVRAYIATIFDRPRCAPRARGLHRCHAELARDTIMELNIAHRRAA